MGTESSVRRGFPGCGDEKTKQEVLEAVGCMKPQKRGRGHFGLWGPWAWRGAGRTPRGLHAGPLHVTLSPSKVWELRQDHKSPKRKHCCIYPCTYLTALLRYNRHTVQSIHSEYTMKWGSEYSQISVTIPTVNFRIFSSPQVFSCLAITLQFPNHRSPFQPSPKQPKLLLFSR